MRSKCHNGTKLQAEFQYDTEGTIMMLSLLIKSLKYLNRMILYMYSKTFKNALNCPKRCKCFASEYVDIAQMMRSHQPKMTLSLYRVNECVVYVVIEIGTVSSRVLSASSFDVCVRFTILLQQRRFLIYWNEVYDRSRYDVAVNFS